MAEYIDKQKAIDELCNVEEYNTRSIATIKDMKPADVRPVVRGKWIEVGGFCTPGGDPVWECSECGKGRHVYGVEHRSYGADVSDGQWVACPNCGADMREVGEDG